jgi:peroxiredoxin
VNYEALPEGLPVPVDDGAADHLAGKPVPSTALPGTHGLQVNLSEASGTTIVFVYPKTARPETPPLLGWEDIPGARGCTPEACGFRDLHDQLTRAGVSGVYGLSSQSTPYQREAVERLHLPYALLSDAEFAWADDLQLPTFMAAGRRFHQRLTLLVRDGTVEHVFYPVFPPDKHAGEVVAWLRSTRGSD